jgi:hypothetical protein
MKDVLDKLEAAYAAANACKDHRAMAEIAMSMFHVRNSQTLTQPSGAMNSAINYGASATFSYSGDLFCTCAQGEACSNCQGREHA